VKWLFALDVRRELREKRKAELQQEQAQ